MPIVDLIAGALIVSLALWGIRAGVGGTRVPACFAAGAVAGALLAPLALSDGHESEFALAVAFPAALLVGGLTAALVERWTPRRQRRGRGPSRRRRRLDVAQAIGGALLAALIGSVAVWLFAAAVSQVTSLRDRVEDSAIVGALDAVLTAPGPDAEQENALFDPFPIVAGAGPPIAPVDPRVVREREVRAADRSVVKVLSRACGRRGQGSGWVAADGVIATNAHVVAAAPAGAIEVRVRGTGPPRPATTIWFDPVNDIALLRVPTLRGVPALTLLKRPPEGAAGAALGFPRGRHSIRAARLGPTWNEIGGRIGGALQPGFPRRLAGRLITSFRGNSEPGSSGGPVVDNRGRVLTTVFGGRSSPGSALGVPNRYVRSALRRAGRRVATGPC